MAKQYRLRMVGGPFDQTEVRQEYEHSPPSHYVWTVVPRETTAFKFGEVPYEPTELLKREIYEAFAIFEDQQGYIALYCWTDISFKRPQRWP